MIFKILITYNNIFYDRYYQKGRHTILKKHNKYERTYAFNNFKICENMHSMFSLVP